MTAKSSTDRLRQHQMSNLRLFEVSIRHFSLRTSMLNVFLLCSSLRLFFVELFNKISSIMKQKKINETQSREFKNDFHRFPSVRWKKFEFHQKLRVESDEFDLRHKELKGKITFSFLFFSKMKKNIEPSKTLKRRAAPIRFV